MRKLVLVVIIAFTISPAIASDFHVTTAQEFQVALTTASNNGYSDTIYLSAGIYGGGFSYLSQENESLVIQPEPKLTAEDVLLDGGGKYRVLNLVNISFQTNFTIRHLTIRNGSDASHGGLYVETSNGDITVTDSVFHSNDGGKSLAVYAEISYPPRLGSVSFQRNKVQNNGFGTYASYPSASVILVSGNVAPIMAEDNIISYNYVKGTSRGAGGLYLTADGSGLSTVKNNTIVGNSGPTWGSGGIEIGGGKVVLSKNKVLSNISSHGAAVKISTGSGTISGNVIAGNSTDWAWVAGLFVRTSQEGAIVVNNLIYNNQNLKNQDEDQATGGVYIGTKNKTYVVNNTITNNSSVAAAGLRADVDLTDSFYMYNNIVWGNVDPSQNSVDIILDGLGTKYGFNNDYTSIVGLWGAHGENIDADPKFAHGDNYYLRSWSPCIDSGRNDAPNLPSTDLDGKPRIANEIVDMGAYEFIKMSGNVSSWLMLLLED